MTMTAMPPSLRVDVLERRGARSRSGWERCVLDEHIQFSAADLETYFFSSWNPIVYDALLVAAVAEFCDRLQRRPSLSWGRSFDLRIPVHQPELWNSKDVLETLVGALSFLTGDRWRIRFEPRKHAQRRVKQGMLQLTPRVRAVIPFSDGLDSRSVAGLLTNKFGDGLVRIRLGAKGRDHPKIGNKAQPFAAVPYRVVERERRFVETSARTRGFKFALVSGVAAYLSGVEEIFMPESGQGIIGPALLPVGQAYEDYRNHPLFLRRMEELFSVLFGYQVRYQFPRIWHTKAETLRAFVDESEDGDSWKKTKSCWQRSRHASINGRLRQCGICAACLLRRLSVHAAGLQEGNETYVWENLKAKTFKAGASRDFPKEKITEALREYAIAGVLHLDHLANLRRSAVYPSVLMRSASQLGQMLKLKAAEVEAKQNRLLRQHEAEWRSFLDVLGSESFVMRWACVV